jgi:lipoate-protein ligase A
MITVLDTGMRSAEENMRLDEKLLEQLDPEGKPLLHFYDWEGRSATFGFFIRPEKHLRLAQAEKLGLSLARRPTGGGIVFHLWDLAFSFLMPSKQPFFSLSPLENYRFVNEAVLEAVREFFSLKETVDLTPSNFSAQESCQNFCMARPTQYDVVYEGKKIAGAAQRRRKQGYLHQGTISLALPEIEFLREVLLDEREVVSAMADYTFAPLGPLRDPARLKEMRQGIQKKLALKLMEKLSGPIYTSSHGKTEACNHPGSRRELL